ncbi:MULTISPECIES: DUF202 domain-containing protein [Tsukamurella]|uniref:DUF202 domain-containing protein n=2 Tax=Tsukamurella strandjordii TaxID=147577 RepID=A0AA90N7C6_9ACTN|nr:MULTISPECIES: DUF202 domain-containing protein [Tsukamurella]MDP0396932.1 hypothetical protein [Tsukamurella strandjordii]GIZ96734.1 hypothetical protein TTY48_13460 [Tsukamurella sp. TY48]
MSAPSTLATERTQLARVRTVMALVLVAALVGRLTLGGRAWAAILCAAVAVVGLGLAVRLGRAPTGAGRALLLSGAVVVLASAAGLGLI